MDNKDRAANIIAHGMKNNDSPARITRHLDDYGLIAPEQRPPHPCPPRDVHQPAWEFRDGEGYPIRSWVSVLAKRIWLTDGKGWGESMTMSQAHDLAAALLSAINYKDAHDD